MERYTKVPKAMLKAKLKNCSTFVYLIYFADLFFIYLIPKVIYTSLHLSYDILTGQSRMGLRISIPCIFRYGRTHGRVMRATRYEPR